MGKNNCICDYCGKEFYKKPSHIKKYKHNYCSRKCCYEHRKVLYKGENNHQYGLKGSKMPLEKVTKK